MESISLSNRTRAAGGHLSKGVKVSFWVRATHLIIMFSIPLEGLLTFCGICASQINRIGLSGAAIEA
jgi:hypothetical protein